MEIDKVEFMTWMNRIMERFDILSSDLNKSANACNSIDGDELLDNQDLLQMLKISNRSLQRYRSTGRLPIIRLAANYITSILMSFSLFGTASLPVLVIPKPLVPTIT